jgi:hypothetical protein
MALPNKKSIPKGFETFAEAEKRRGRKIRLLRKGSRHERRLAAKLDRCRKLHRCESGTCDVCVGLYRLDLYRKSRGIFATHPNWTRVSVVPVGFLKPVGELVSADLLAIASLIDKRMERSSLRNRLGFIGIDISLNTQDNETIGWQLHLYMLVEGENTLRLREAIKAAFPPEPSAAVPYRFRTVRDAVKAITYLFKSIFQRRSRYWTANGQARTTHQSLKGSELRELLTFLDQYPIGARLILRGIRRSGKRFVIINKNPNSPK